MMPCRPAMMFWSIVGHAMRQTTGPMGPSMIERSYFQGLGATSGTGSPVYYAVFRLSDYRWPLRMLIVSPVRCGNGLHMESGSMWKPTSPGVRLHVESG